MVSAHQVPVTNRGSHCESVNNKSETARHTNRVWNPVATALTPKEKRGWTSNTVQDHAQQTVHYRMSQIGVNHDKTGGDFRIVECPRNNCHYTSRSRITLAAMGPVGQVHWLVSCLQPISHPFVCSPRHVDSILPPSPSTFRAGPNSSPNEHRVDPAGPPRGTATFGGDVAE